MGVYEERVRRQRELWLRQREVRALESIARSLERVAGPVAYVDPMHEPSCGCAACDGLGVVGEGGGVVVGVGGGRVNPWPDDYVEAPDEHTAYQAWKEHAVWSWIPVLGHYLHHLTEQVRALQALCDEQAAEREATS